MDASTWIALAALAVAALGPTVSRLTADARRDGKIDAAIEQLTKISQDHEDRLRKGRL
jgi:hypothetical protein